MGVLSHGLYPCDRANHAQTRHEIEFPPSHGALSSIRASSSEVPVSTGGAVNADLPTPSSYALAIQLC